MAQSTAAVDLARQVRELLEEQRQAMVDLLREMVEIESPSDDADRLKRMADLLQARFSEFGPVERVLAPGAAAPHLELRARGATNERPLLILCHYDTVWTTGTLRTTPFSVDAAGIARGPGCFDMKGGIVLLYYALWALHRLNHIPRRPIIALFTSDEETGSLTSRALIEERAREAELALVIESPLAGGRLKTARKGTGDYRLRVEGRAAHAGVEPEKGISAIHELAEQILALQALNDPRRGTTVNVGVISGGTRPNVVPATAEAQIDVRVTTLAEAARLDAAIHALRPRLPGASLVVDGGLNRPPMERLPGTGRLFEQARAIAAGVGIPDLQEGSTGGGSDGNFTAALGVPTLDGLGPEGEGAHAAHEQVVVESLPRRGALLAGLLLEA